MNKAQLFVPFAWVLAGLAQAESSSLILLDEARTLVGQSATALQTTLQKELEDVGLVDAMEDCHLQRPLPTAMGGENDWWIGRTSEYPRNAGNQPDAWEAEVLQSFAARLAGGEALATLEAFTFEKGQFRYMKAIASEGLCLGCHGDKLTAPVVRRLAELYPADKAVGDQEGQLRGAYTLVKTLKE